MARPKKYRSAVRITLYLDSEMAKILSHIARERGVSRSHLVSEILFQYVSQYYKDAASSNDETRSEVEKFITREWSSIKSLVQRLISYCKDSECVKELISKYGEAIISKLASIEDLAVKYKVTTVIPEIERIKQILNSYR